MTNSLHKFHSLLLFFLACLILEGCRSSKEFTGFSYDPEGVTVTTDKQTDPQYKRRIGVDGGSVWISNEYAGARMNDFFQLSDSVYRVVIQPENHPINNSPWYSFKVWSDSARSVNLQLKYEHGKHRYLPKVSSDRTSWQPVDISAFNEDTTAGTATISLSLDSSPVWISAQELITWQDYQMWLDNLSSHSFATTDTIGYSHNQRPLIRMIISSASQSKNRGVLVITGRQHPPEVTGAIAAKAFIEELSSESPLARQFRQEFEVWAYPLMNPDGVEAGHWRHNDAGVDLNRDWHAFNQPETRAVRDDLIQLKNDSLRSVYYGIDFHSTDENIFYPINREISTFPEDFTYQWIESLKHQFPDHPLSVEPFDTSSPIAKNWIYRTFGADAVTYEINDRANRDSINTVTRASARIIMQKLLDIKKSSTAPLNNSARN